MRRIWIYAVLAVLSAGFVLWWFSPVQVLKRRTVMLLETLTLDSGSSRNGRQLAIYSLSGLLASEVELETPAIEQASGTFTREELESAFSWLCAQARQTRFELQDFESVTVSGGAGDVSCELKALVELPTFRPADGIYRVRFFWRRVDDKWCLERVICTEVKR